VVEINFVNKKYKISYYGLSKNYNLISSRIPIGSLCLFQKSKYTNPNGKNHELIHKA
jgi:hypothetical protein